MQPFENNNDVDLNRLLEEKPLKMQWIYDTAIKNGTWEIIGNIPVEQNFEMPYFSTDDGVGKYYLIKGGDTYRGVGGLIEVCKEEGQKAYSFGIGNEISLPKHCIYKLGLLNMI
jgi:hypothetical protein